MNNRLLLPSDNPLFLSPSSSLGGAEKVLLSLLEPWSICEYLNKPTVAFIEEGPLTKVLAASDFPTVIRKIPDVIRRIGDSPARKESQIGRVIRMGSALPSLIRLVSEWKTWLFGFSPCWIHSNGFKTHFLSACSVRSNIPIFWHIHDFVGDRPFMRKLLRLVWRPGIQALAISKAVADDFSKEIPACPVRVWHNAIDCEKFQPKSIDGSWLDAVSGITNGFQGFRIGLVATYARWKGHGVFLEACSRLVRKFDSTVRFYVVGGPVYQTEGSQWSKSELRDRICKLGLSGKIGLIPFQIDTAKVYQSLDLVVHASTRREPFGLVIGEAMACGKPVVAALHGGASEIGRHGIDCVGHEPGNPDSLARAIEKLILDGNLREQLCINSRQRILNNFGKEKVWINWQALLGELRVP